MNYDRCISCRVIRCKSKNVKFFRFPKDEERCRQWVLACNLNSLLTVPAVDMFKRYRLCSRHFLENDYASSKKERLKSTACPTKFEERIIVSGLKEKLKNKLTEKCKTSVSINSQSIPGTVEVYTSKWFAFDRMKFLLNKVPPQNTEDLQDECFNQGIDVVTDTEDEQSVSVLTEEESLSREKLQLSTVPEPYIVHCLSVDTSQPSSTKRKMCKDPQTEVGVKNFKNGNQIEEESKVDEMLDSYGRYVVSKMKRYCRQTQLTVEHEINKILYQADMGCYDG